MSVYPSLEELKLDEFTKSQIQVGQQNDNPSAFMAICPPHPSGMDQKSMDAFYPILNNYMGLELSTVAQNNSVANPMQTHQVQVTNGVRKMVLCKDRKGIIGLKLSIFNSGVFVGLVTQNSPAAIAGIRFGDQILQINDEFVTGMSVEKVYKMFKESPVNNINVIVRDRPLERTINLYKDRAGQVGFQFKNGKINNIVKDSSAARNGVLTDHQLLEINGQNIVGMKDKELVDIITKASDMITITIIPVAIYDHMIKNINNKEHYTAEIPLSYGTEYEMTEPIDNDLNEKKADFLKKLAKVDRNKLQLRTVEQSNNKEWHTERKKRLTASNFGEICKMRANTSCQNKVYSLLYRPYYLSPGMMHGIEMESLARNKFEELSGKTVQLCGLFSDNEFHYLAASPDGLVGEDAILEIKCPFVAKDTLSAIKAVQDKLLDYCYISNNTDIIKLKENHKYYFQVMGQLHITKRTLCYFVIHTHNWTNIEEIKYDEVFWKNNMVEKLKLFYLECMLPEIISPLYKLRQQVTDIREPLYIKEAQKNKKIAPSLIKNIMDHSSV